MTPQNLAHGKLEYIEIPAVDIQRSADFYAKVFHWRITKRQDGSTAFEDTTGQVSGTWVLGRPPSTEPGLLIYIVVENVPATIETITASGGQIAVPGFSRRDEAHQRQERGAREVVADVLQSVGIGEPSGDVRRERRPENNGEVEGE